MENHPTSLLPGATLGYDGMAFVSQYDEDRLADPKIMDSIKRIHARIDADIGVMDPAFRQVDREIALTERLDISTIPRNSLAYSFLRVV